MRFIAKGSEPEQFKDWKALENDDWKPTYDDLANPEKQAVFTALIAEQKGLCCYCERELKESDCHLEHLNPQSAGAGDDLDFNNFLCSCLRTTDKGDPLHCGMKKGNELLPITPLQAGCGAYFSFSGDGKIKGLNDEAKKTIEILALDIPKLIDLRKGTLDAFYDEALSIEEQTEFLQKYISEEGDNPSPFISAIKSVFSVYLE